MKIEYTIQPGCTLEQEVPNVKMAFKFLAYVGEVFGITHCGNCKSTNLKRKFRTAARKDNGAKCEYYSIECKDCRHEMKFGQKQEDGAPLFPKGWEPPYQGDGGGQQYNQQEPTYYNNGDEYAQAPPLQNQARAAVPAGAGDDIAF